MAYPIPKYLRGIFVVDAKPLEEHLLQGAVKCECGSDGFHPLYVGNRVKDLRCEYLQVVEIGGQWFCRIGARCVSCEKEHLLFDDHFHGWNGYVCADEEVRQIERPPLTEWSCQWCKATPHRVALGIQGEDMETALGESSETLTEDDWFEAFGWITVDVTCKSCGRGPTRIVDYETM